MTELPRLSYSDRIRAGEIQPFTGHGSTDAGLARASAEVVADELDSLGRDDPRRAELEEQRKAWLDRAAVLAEHTEEPIL